jgi:Fe2+ transport system protein FeoA
MTLDEARTHSTLRILLVSDDWSTRRQLNQLGLHAGERIHVVRRAPFGGPLVIESGNSRVAISKQLAKRIRVEVIP